jgi:Tfp pilus assembly protein PilN
MPTGYTAAIKGGLTFEQFAMSCARAFGACISLRDESGGGEKIPERFEPSDYHQRALAKAQQELADVKALTPDACEQRATEEHRQAEEHRQQCLREVEDLRQKYDQMLDAVSEWVPPSADHRELRTFMRDQIEQSSKFDCDTEFYTRPTPRLTGAEWKKQRIKTLQGSIVYHEEGHAAEVERTNQRNEWIRLLRESLQPV